MTFTPSARCLWFIGFFFVPVCLLPAFIRNGEVYVALSAVIVLSIGLFDLLVSKNNLDGLAFVLPEQIRAVVHRQQSLPIEVRRQASARFAPHVIRIAVALPRDVDPVRDDMVMTVPELHHGAASELLFFASTRGEFSITQAFLGAASWLRLWQIRRAIPIQATILIEPPLSKIAKQAAMVLATHRRGGQRLLPQNGRGREFEQLREYVPSDDLGDIDWKATARRHHPIVRDYQIERTQDVYACIDFSRLSGRSVIGIDGQRTTMLDAYISSALMLHYAVRESGDRFGLVTFSNRVRYFAKPSHPGSAERVLRQALYPLQPQMVAPAFDEASAALLTQAKRRALLVFFTNLGEPQLAESFLQASRLLSRQHLVLVASPADAYAKPVFSDPEIEDIDDIYGKLAGHLFWKKLAMLRARLGEMGIRMRALAPDRLGFFAANEYLDIKEKQLL